VELETALEKDLMLAVNPLLGTELKSRNDII
jgi:hypothetical protein